MAVAYAEPRPERSARDLRELRAKLGQGVGQEPTLLSPRFDRYVEAVLPHSGYHVETVRRHLEAGLERLLEPLSYVGAFDAKTFEEMWASAERAVDGASTIVDVVSPSRQLVADIGDALRNATSARRDRSLRRALEFIRDHLSEPSTVTGCVGSRFCPGLLFEAAETQRRGRLPELPAAATDHASQTDAG